MDAATPNTQKIAAANMLFSAVALSALVHELSETTRRRAYAVSDAASAAELAEMHGIPRAVFAVLAPETAARGSLAVQRACVKRTITCVVRIGDEALLLAVNTLVLAQTKMRAAHVVLLLVAQFFATVAAAVLLRTVVVFSVQIVAKDLFFVALKRVAFALCFFFLQRKKYAAAVLGLKLVCPPLLLVLATCISTPHRADAFPTHMLSEEMQRYLGAHGLADRLRLEKSAGAVIPLYVTRERSERSIVVSESFLNFPRRAFEGFLYHEVSHLLENDIEKRLLIEGFFAVAAVFFLAAAQKKNTAAARSPRTAFRQFAECELFSTLAKLARNAFARTLETRADESVPHSEKMHFAAGLATAMFAHAVPASTRLYSLLYEEHPALSVRIAKIEQSCFRPAGRCAEAKHR